MSSTAASIENAASVDARWVMKVFRKVVEADEWVELIRKLIKHKVGVNEVEEFFEDLAETHRNAKYRSKRKTKEIVSIMKDKLQDSFEDRRMWRGQKAAMIKRVHQIWGERAVRTKSLLSEAVR